MERILIVNNNMHIGGVQKALVSLLWTIREQYDVTLLLFCKDGECYSDLPPDVQVINTGSAFRFLGMSGQNAHNVWDKLCRGFFAAITRMFGRKCAVALMSLGQKKIKGYDVAISYLHNAGDKTFYGGCNDFVLKHVDARRKVAFLHCDYVRSGANTPNNNKMYAQFDAIAACSQGCMDSFVGVNPDLRGKIFVVPNCHRFDQIQEKAKAEAIAFPQETVNIVTVARLGKEKGVERAVRAVVRLKQERSDFHYYIIGDGIQKEEIQRMIRQEGLSDCVTLLGEKSNPYGYLKAADLLWIPSYSEAAPLVIGEAVCLGTPILSTETSSAKEMIEKTGYGWVCENTEDAMVMRLKQILMNRTVLDTMKKRLRTVTSSNAAALEAFGSLLGELSK